MRAFSAATFPLILCFITAFLSCFQVISAPLRINIEAEDYFSKAKDFVIRDDTFTSNSGYIALKEDAKPVTHEKLLAQIPFRSKGNFAIWIRSRDLTLSLRSSSGINKEIKAPSDQWTWISAGIFADRQIGAMLEIYALKTGPESGLDAILLSNDPKFQPRGIYNEFFSNQIKSQTDRISSLPESPDGNTVTVTVSPDDISGSISPFIATACADDPKRHLDGRKRFSNKGVSLVGNERWDATMKTFFQGNLLILLFRPIRDKNGDYLSWDFESLDRYVNKAINVWGCRELMFLPRWNLPSIRKNQAPAKAEKDAGEEFFMQLIKRYGNKGHLQVKYWAAADEWTLKRYWSSHTEEFVKYYSRLISKAKAYNPELKLGGPVDAWPNNSVISELLKECPQLDFITWNMYISGNAGTPLDKLYQRTGYLEYSTIASREISKRIRHKELPVIITAYGPNYRAWDPPDLKLAGPSNAVWQTLALSRLVKGGAFAAGSFNVMSRDYGLFGPRDLYAIDGGFIPDDIDDKTIYIRPAARIIRFFRKYAAGQSICGTTCKGSGKDSFSVLAIRHAGQGIAIALVNSSRRGISTQLKINNYKMTAPREFDLPTEYIYCDQNKIIEGKGFFFNKNGITQVEMPPFSAWLFYVVQAKR